MISSDQLKVYWDLYYDRMFALALTKTRDYYISSEIATDVFISLWRLGSIREDTILSWLCIAIVNRCNDHFRKKKSDKHSTIVYTDYDEDFHDSTQTLESILSDSIHIEIIIHLIDQLPEERKKVFELYLAGKKSTEISDMLSISKQTALNQKTKAIKWLRSKILNQ